MSFDIYGDRLARGHCEVHPHVHQEYPCDLCLSQRSPKQRAPAGPMCGICGEHEACADSCGVAVCSEACDHEARRRQDESEALRARITELEAQCESAHAAQRHAETELAQYMAWYAMAEHQHLQEEARAERAEADAEVGRRWRDDSSLEAWFPYTAQELASLKDERDQLRAAIEQAPHERDCKKQRSLIADCNCWKADALRAARGGE